MTTTDTTAPRAPRPRRPRPGPRPAIEFYSAQDVADALRCSEDHVRQLIKAGVLPVVDISVPGSQKRTVRVRSDDLTAYTESLRERTA